MTNYYLSPTGNNASAGTSAGAAWQTIARLNTALSDGTIVAGDTVYLESGATFSGSILIGAGAAGGGSASPLTITKSGSARAKILSGNSPGICTVDAGIGGIVIASLEIEGATITAEADGTTTFPTGAEYRHTGIDFLSTKNTLPRHAYIRVNNCIVHGYYRGIAVRADGYKYGYDDVLIENNEVYDCVDQGILVRGSDSHTPTDYYGPYVGLDTASGAAVGQGNGSRGKICHSNVRIWNCHVYDVYADHRITGDATGAGIVFSNLTNAGKSVPVVKNCLVHNCVTNAPCTFGNSYGVWFYESEGAYVVDSVCHSMRVSAGAKVRNPTGYQIDVGGFDNDGACSNTGILNCLAFDCDGAGVAFGTFPNADFENIEIAGNVVINCDAYGQGSIKGFRNGNWSDSIFVHHNTVFAPDYPACKIASNAYPFIYNNIFIRESDGPIVETAVNFTTFLGNHYWKPDGDFEVLIDGDTYTSLSAWRSGAAAENISGSATGLFADPLLPDMDTSPSAAFTVADLAAFRAYKPGEASGAYGAGLDLTTLDYPITPSGDDMAGNAYNNALRNIGAWYGLFDEGGGGGDVINYRISEAGDQRISESGDNRVSEDSTEDSGSPSDLFILTGGGSVRPGYTRQLRASTEATWSVPGGAGDGTINASTGLYTAPPQSGLYTVRATRVAAPNDFVEVKIPVRRAAVPGGSISWIGGGGAKTPTTNGNGRR